MSGISIASASADRIRTLEAAIMRIAEGDRASLESLYRETSVGVYSYTLSLMKNREDAEDILQEVYLHIFRSASSYTPRGKPLEWMMKITKNLCLSALRSRRSHAELREDAAVDFDTAQMSDDRLMLYDALRMLGDEERQTVILHTVSGLRHREIAAVMGVPLPTVTSRYSRAVKKLRNYLMRGGAFDD